MSGKTEIICISSLFVIVFLSGCVGQPQLSQSLPIPNTVTSTTTTTSSPSLTPVKNISVFPDTVYIDAIYFKFIKTPNPTCQNITNGLGCVTAFVPQFTQYSGSGLVTWYSNATIFFYVQPFGWTASSLNSTCNYEMLHVQRRNNTYAENYVPPAGTICSPDYTQFCPAGDAWFYQQFQPIFWQCTDYVNIVVGMQP